MSSYGVGQGLNEGVKTLAGMIVPMQRMKMMKEQNEANQKLKQQYADAYTKATQFKAFGNPFASDEVLSRYMPHDSQPAMQGERLGLGTPNFGAPDLMQQQPQPTPNNFGMGPAAMLMEP